MQPLAWIPEDELPESLPAYAYNELFPHSRVDGIRLFPVFGPSANTIDALVAALDRFQRVARAELGASRPDLFEQADTALALARGECGGE